MKKAYQKPAMQTINVAPSTILAASDIKMGIENNNDNQTVSTETDLWSNRRTDSPIWGNEE